MCRAEVLVVSRAIGVENADELFALMRPGSVQESTERCVPGGEI